MSSARITSRKQAGKKQVATASARARAASGLIQHQLLSRSHDQSPLESTSYCEPCGEHFRALLDKQIRKLSYFRTVATCDFQISQKISLEIHFRCMQRRITIALSPLVAGVEVE